MTQPLPPSHPPFGDDTDEALSALLDGELDAFATGHGITEADARERLESWGDFEPRRAALEQVRGAMQVATPELDDLTRRRLVRTASSELPGAGAAPSSSRRGWALIAAVAAAVLLVVAGIGFAISSMGGDDASMTSGDSAATATAPLRGNVGDLGDVTSPEALRSLLDRRERAATADESAESAQDGATSRSGAPSGADSGAGVTGDGGGFDSAPAVSPEVCASQLAGDREVAFTGTGTYEGAPVTIVGVAERGRTIVFVVARTDCTDVLTSISR